MLHEQRQFDALAQTIDGLIRGHDTYPHCVEIHPTDFCNQACSYCFHGGAGEDTSRRAELLTPSEYLALIDELESLRVTELSVSGGGEPLLYRGIAELLARVAESALRLRLVTNANHMPDELLPSLVRADEVRVSIDSLSPATYNEMRGLRGGCLLERTLNNLRRLADARRRAGGQVRLACTFLVSDANLSEIESFAESLLEDVGVDVVVFKWDIYGPAAALQDPSLRARFRQLDKRFGAAVEVRGDRPTTPVAGPCVVPHFKVAFDPYGGLHSCCLGAQPGEVNGVELGSLRMAGSFGALWSSSAPMRLGMRTRGVGCRDCNHTDAAINRVFRAHELVDETSVRFLPLVSAD